MKDKAEAYEAAGEWAGGNSRSEGPLSPGDSIQTACHRKSGRYVCVLDLCAGWAVAGWAVAGGETLRYSHLASTSCAAGGRVDCDGRHRPPTTPNADHASPRMSYLTQRRPDTVLCHPQIGTSSLHGPCPSIRCTDETRGCRAHDPLPMDQAQDRECPRIHRVRLRFQSDHDGRKGRRGAHKKSRRR